jgi:hypothetical protein
MGVSFFLRTTAMRKLYVALIATFGLAGLAASVPAEAGVVVGVGVPGVAVDPPRVVIGPGVGFYGRPYYYGGPRFYGPGVRVGYGWGRGWGWGYRGGRYRGWR